MLTDSCKAAALFTARSVSMEHAWSGSSTPSQDSRSMHRGAIPTSLSVSAHVRARQNVRGSHVFRLSLYKQYESASQSSGDSGKQRSSSVRMYSTVVSKIHAESRIHSLRISCRTHPTSAIRVAKDKSPAHVEVTFASSNMISDC